MNPLLIQRPATGVLDLLGTKAMGQGPVLLAETVAMTLADCVDYYTANRRSTLVANTAAAVTANNQQAINGLTVPFGELWLVYSITAQLAGPTAAATGATYWGGFFRASVTNTMIPLTDTVTAGASDNVAATRVFERPHVLSPGDQCCFRTGAVTGVPGVAGQIVLDLVRLST